MPRRGTVPKREVLADPLNTWFKTYFVDSWDRFSTNKNIVPAAKVVGTLYNGSEANSRSVVEVARELFAKRGIRLQEVTIASSTEV